MAFSPYAPELFLHLLYVAVMSGVSAMLHFKPVYTPLALRDWFRAAPRNPQRSKPKAPGRWVRSLRDHNHLRVACWAFLSVKVEPLRGRLIEPLTPKIPAQRREVTLALGVEFRFLKIR